MTISMHSQPSQARARIASRFNPKLMFAGGRTTFSCASDDANSEGAVRHALRALAVGEA